jgi:3'(2'), 5'-bisphosphate nucleotidase
MDRGDKLSLLVDDHALAAHVAAEAGRLLLGMRDFTRDPRELKADGDHRSHEFIVQFLGRERPGDAILSEEGADDPARLAADRVWIIDPIDGTREFGENGRSDWAVHVALVVEGQLTVGAVALPALDLVLSTGGGAGALPLRPSTPQRRRILVSRTRPLALAQALAAELDADLVPMGSSGAKAMAVVRGEGDIYVHAGGQYEWDSAAPVAVARASGLHTSRIDGSPLVYNQPNSWLPDQLVCPQNDADQVLAAIAKVSQ